MKRLGFILSLVLFIVAGTYGTFLIISKPPGTILETKLPELEDPKETPKPLTLIFPDGKIIKDRFLVPKDYKRISVNEESYEEYLRNLPLKPHGTDVFYYNGNLKRNTSVHQGVIDIDVGDRDLQQCADATIRLRAEYLFQQGLYEHISFQFTNGFPAEYLKWRQGYRIALEGNHTSWVRRADPSDDYASFRKYLDLVFAYAGTLSLSKELPEVSIEDMTIGDIIIQGGSPGHAVMVVDMAEHGETGEKIFLLAQSYMPAQDIHVLRNPSNTELSPWYSLNPGSRLVTPEWTFEDAKVRRFK